MKYSSIALLSIVLLSLMCTGNLFAEVSVVLDDQGHYVKMLTLFKTKNHHTFYWEPARRGVLDYLMLNMTGDLNGDGQPRWAVHPFEKTPWVVWPYFDGNDFKIAYSQWTETGWSDPSIIEKTGRNVNDVDPTIAFEGSGIPFVAFTRKAKTSQVYVTAFIDGRWIHPLLVSDPSINCTEPTLIFQRDIALVVFLTPDGIKFVHLDQLGSDEKNEESDTNGIEEGPNPLPENTPSDGGGHIPSFHGTF